MTPSPSRSAAATRSRLSTKWVLDHYTGISPLIAREFAFRAGHETDVRFGALNDTQRGALVQEFSDTANAVKEG